MLIRSWCCGLGLSIGAMVLMPAHSQKAFAVILANDTRLSNFSALLNRIEVSPSIAKTIFAPSLDGLEALRKQEDSLWDKYVSKPEYFAHLREVLLWHLVTEGAFTFSEIFDGSRQLLENSLFNITVDQRFKKIDNVASTSFAEANITSSEGVLHVIDDVIIPPYMAVNLIEHMLERDTSVKFAYTTMAVLAQFAGLEEKINAVYENGITFLVPPNPRFNRANINVPKLLTPEMQDYTRDFVLAHLIMDNYYEAGIFAYNDENDQEEFMVVSELGTSLWITTTDGYLRFQSRKLLLTDRPARNGIFHVMDLPVYPPYISDFTELTAWSTSWDTSDCFRFFRQALLGSGDISQMFNSSLTMFCPTREAFGLFNNEDFQRLLEPMWVRHATEFLLNHFTAPALTREELVSLAPSMITMLNGQEYELKKSGDRVRIKNTDFEQARTVFGDIIALDGYLHIVDTAITPTAVSRSIYDQSNVNPDFDLLVENIDFVQLTDMVDRQIPLTLLAPNNRAFQRVSFGTLDGAEIIKRHIFSGLLFCDVIANKTSMQTVDGETIGVELRGEPGSGLWGILEQNLYVGGAYVYGCDLFARNGVVHYVDRVIGVEYDTVSPTVTPGPTVTPQPTSQAIPTEFAPTNASPGMVSPTPTLPPNVTLSPTVTPQPTVAIPATKAPTRFAPTIVLPPILPAVVPSVKTEDAPTPTEDATDVSGTCSVPLFAFSSILCTSWLLATLF